MASSNDQLWLDLDRAMHRPGSPSLHASPWESGDAEVRRIWAAITDAGNRTALERRLAGDLNPHARLVTLQALSECVGTAAIAARRGGDGVGAAAASLFPRSDAIILSILSACYAAIAIASYVQAMNPPPDEGVAHLATIVGTMILLLITGMEAFIAFILLLLLRRFAILSHAPIRRFAAVALASPVFAYLAFKMMILVS